MARELKTRAGTVTFPAFVPVTTFGSEFPLDPLVRPYLCRLAPAALVSYPYAQAPAPALRVPLYVDSGGFAGLQPGARIEEEYDLGVVVTPKEDGGELRITPQGVLDLQERIADVAFTLDFPIPPGTERAEADRRLRLSMANATWAIQNRRRRDLPLYAGVQGLDVEDYRRAAKALAAMPFEGFAIGGLVPRARDADLVLAIVAAVRAEVGTRPLHAFGLGSPEMLSRIFAAGVDSSDSSSYLRLAAEGKRWGSSDVLADPSPSERLNLALCNLAAATGRAVPLSAARAFTTQALGRP